MERLERFMMLLKQADFLKEQLLQASELLERLKSEEMIISVIGQFKRGKSSLINAILGEELLPTGIIPLTTVITEIRYGRTLQICVKFTDGTRKEIPLQELEDYCSESLNPENRKKVDTVLIQTPSHPFGEGIVLVDTPGVGSVHQHNTDSSYDYIKHSDAIIFLLSVDSPVSETERDFLLKADQYAGKFFYAVNKTDTVTEKDLHTFLVFCKKVLTKATGLNVNIFPVSARTGTGIEELKSTLKRELNRSHDKILKESLIKKMNLIKEQAVAKIRLSVKSMDLSGNDLTAVLHRMEEKQKALQELSSLASAIGKQKADMLIEEIREELKKESDLLKTETEKQSDLLYDRLKALPTKQFEEQFQKSLNDFLKDGLTAMNEKGKELLEDGYKKIAADLNQQAEEAAVFLNRFLKEEFDVDYPVSKKVFLVSQKSDFLFHFGYHGQLLLDKNEFSRLLPKKIAIGKIYKRCQKTACQDIDRNRNNMIYNYNYKMQESFRGFYGELDRSIRETSAELDTLMAQIQKDLNEKGTLMEQKRTQLLALLEKIENCQQTDHSPAGIVQ